MSSKKLRALALLIGLSCPAARAGTITYNYHNTFGNDPGLGYLVVGEAALFRGEILSNDVEAFSFDGYRLQDLAPVDIPISTVTALPLAGSTLTASREIVPGIFASLTLFLGADGFGSWQSSTPGSHDLFGTGEWSVDLAVAPEPSGLVLGSIALACVGFMTQYARRKSGHCPHGQQDGIKID